MHFIWVDYDDKLNSTQSSSLPTELTIKFSYGFTIICLNIFLFYVTFVKPNVPHCHRVVNLLIAHLACLSSMNIVINWCNTGEAANIIPVSGTFCGLVNHLKNVMHSTLLSHMLVTTYERLKSFSEEYISSTRKTAPLIFTIWSVSVFFSIPTAWMKTGIENSLERINKNNASNAFSLVTCKPVELMGSWEATVIYEALRFLVFYVCTGFYLICASIKIRSKLQYLVSNSHISPEELKHHMSYNRMIYFYLFSFCTIQFLSGMIELYKKVLLQSLDINVPIIENLIEALDVYLSPALAVDMHMSPLISSLFLVGLKCPCDVCFCRQRETPAITNEPEDCSNMAGSAEYHHIINTSYTIYRNVHPKTQPQEPRSRCETCVRIKARTLETLV